MTFKPKSQVPGSDGAGVPWVVLGDAEELVGSVVGRRGSVRVALRPPSETATVKCVGCCPDCCCGFCSQKQGSSSLSSSESGRISFGWAFLYSILSIS